MDRSGLILRTESRGLFSSGDTSDNDYEMGAGCGGAQGVCVCDSAPCTLYSELHTDTSPRPWRNSAEEEPLLCEHCGKNRNMVTRYSEGYGTEEECGLSDPQGESDADADIEDTDSRLQEPGSLQRISSRRRKRPRIARQDTTESEDDGAHSNRTHRWNLRLSPAHNRTIVEESISQVRPLVVCAPGPDRVQTSVRSRRALARPLLLLLSLALLVLSYFLFWTNSA